MYAIPKLKCRSGQMTGHTARYFGGSPANIKMLKQTHTNCLVYVCLFKKICHCQKNNWIHSVNTLPQRKSWHTIDTNSIQLKTAYTPRSIKHVSYNI